MHSNSAGRVIDRSKSVERSVGMRDVALTHKMRNTWYESMANAYMSDIVLYGGATLSSSVV